MSCTRQGRRSGGKSPEALNSSVAPLYGWHARPLIQHLPHGNVITGEKPHFSQVTLHFVETSDPPRHGVL